MFGQNNIVIHFTTPLGPTKRLPCASFTSSIQIDQGTTDNKAMWFHIVGTSGYASIAHGDSRIP
jgi:hypothetical protein